MAIQAELNVRKFYSLDFCGFQKPEFASACLWYNYVLIESVNDYKTSFLASYYLFLHKILAIQE